jgi:hypothetical protein
MPCEVTWQNPVIPHSKSIDFQDSMMLAQASLSPSPIEQTLEQILTSRKITSKEQRWLISLCFKGSLSYQQEHLINQVYEALRNGWLAVIK